MERLKRFWIAFKDIATVFSFTVNLVLVVVLLAVSLPALRTAFALKTGLVEPLLSDKFFIEPVEGLDAGDMVVVAGQAGLKDGALVSLPGDEVPEKDEGESS